MVFCISVTIMAAAALTMPVLGAPMQAHLSLTRRTDELRIVWVSNTSGGVPTVYATQDGATNASFVGSSTTYTIDEYCAAPANEPANFEAPGQINTVTMTGLKVGVPVKFWYGTAPDGFAASTSRFASPRNLVILADMGRASESITMLGKEMNETDLVLFPGDLSYSMGRKGVWAEWFELVEPVFSQVPAFFSCGNHDVLQLQGSERFWPSWGSYELDSGTQGECGVPFQHLVAMDGEDGEGNRVVNNNWTSLDLPGVAHVVSLSSEHNFTAGSEQAEWLVSDLARVNRSSTPWVVVQLHRPMYDSTFNALLPEEAATRTILEPLFEAAGVDLVLTAHIHDYQSMHCRIYNGTCRDGVGGAGPVGRPVMVVGGGGKTSGIRAWMDAPDWLAARTDGLGYARFRPANGTAALWEWVFNTNGTAFDSHWIERPVASAAREARDAGDSTAPPAGSGAEALEAWRRQRFTRWWRAGAVDPRARQGAGLTHPGAAAAAVQGRVLAERDGHAISPERLLKLWAAEE